MKIGRKKISRLRVIKHLITSHFVPCKVTTCYKVMKLFKLGKIPVCAAWSELGKHGKKRYLSSEGLKSLISSIQQQTEGGFAMSLTEIRGLVLKKIKEEWKNRRSLHLLPTIPVNTLTQYASVIKAQSIFNVHSSIENKTEARVAAEWSQRSTISYGMTVAATHYIADAEPSKYHPKTKDISVDSLEMLNFVEEAYNKMTNNQGKKIKMIPVLPHLVTSTDEVTIFATPNKINGTDSYYLVAKPTTCKNEQSNSSNRNHYKTKVSGDSHCRGVRIVINNTFTAGGLSSPLFVTVYGLTLEEMPGDEIVTIEVPGLTVGSNQDLYSKGKGFLTFVRGNYEDHDEVSERDHTSNENEEDLPSKEARVAKIYQEKVFYPFIQHIRKVKYVE